MSAEDAVDWGVVTRMAPHDDLMAVATEVLTTCCYAAPKARANVKRAINMQYGLTDRMTFTATMFEDEFAEGWQAFAERRAPSWIAEEIRPEGRL